MKPWKKYSIEFLVIVLGILTAINFENWNQDRLNKNNEIELVKQLLSDAIADTLFFNTRLEGYRSIDSIYTNLYLLYKNQDNDSLKKTPLSTTFYNSFAYQSNLINNNPDAYDQLSNKQIKTELRLYKAKYEYVSGAIEMSNKKIDKLMLDISLKVIELSNSDTAFKTYEDYAFLFKSNKKISKIIFLSLLNKNATIQINLFLVKIREIIVVLKNYLIKNEG